MNQNKHRPKCNHNCVIMTSSFFCRVCGHLETIVNWSPVTRDPYPGQYHPILQLLHLGDGASAAKSEESGLFEQDSGVIIPHLPHRHPTIKFVYSFLCRLFASFLFFFLTGYLLVSLSVWKPDSVRGEEMQNIRIYFPRNSIVTEPKCIIFNFKSYVFLFSLNMTIISCLRDGGFLKKKKCKLNTKTGPLFCVCVFIRIVKLLR